MDEVLSAAAAQVKAAEAQYKAVSAISQRIKYCNELSRSIIPHATNVLRALPIMSSYEEPSWFSNIHTIVLGLYWFSIRGMKYMGRTREAWLFCLNWRRLLFNDLGRERNTQMFVQATLHIGCIASLNGFFEEADKWHDKYHYQCNLQYGEDMDSESKAISLHNRGCNAKRKGMFDEAENLFKQSLDMLQRIHGHDADHPHNTGSLRQLGVDSKEKYLLDEAKKGGRAEPRNVQENTRGGCRPL